MAEATPTFRLADTLLQGGLADLVTQHRAAGRSWRWIARDLFEQTNGEIDVTQETLRNWFPDAAKGAA